MNRGLPAVRQTPATILAVSPKHTCDGPCESSSHVVALIAHDVSRNSMTDGRHDPLAVFRHRLPVRPAGVIRAA